MRGGETAVPCWCPDAGVGRSATFAHVSPVRSGTGAYRHACYSLRAPGL